MKKNVELRNICFFENAYNRCADILDSDDFYGIVRKTNLRFLNIPSLADKFPPCIDHDIFEGILPKIISFSLRYFINSNIFSFLTFKNTVANFMFLGKDKSNFPLFEFDNLSKIKFTAEEGYTFIRFYLILLRSVPKDDDVLILLKVFTKIVLIMMSFSISTEAIIILDNLIENFLLLCSKHNNEIGMTVKFHHLIHYSRYISLFGPPRLFSTRNFESMHSSLKAKIKNSKNWKLVPYTIASKYSRNKLSEKCCDIRERGVKLCVSIVPEFPELVTTDNIANAFTLLSLHYHNIVYYCNRSAILINKSESATLFLLISKIFKINDEYIFVGEVCDSYYDEDESIFILNTLDYNDKIYLMDLSDYHSYEIYRDNFKKFLVPYFLDY